MNGKTKLKKGDQVVVTTGKEKGKKGEISELILKRMRVLITGVNVVKKHKKSQSENKKPNIVEEAAPLQISNVQFFCSKCDAGVRLGYKLEQDGTKSRFCKKCGTTIAK
ncbi:MAG: 50S ribosomal protein L24 [Spirochaetae bacterium HGW-Spirochaetae-6]|nr:MAG: 50S ribosomal protein L24 [Spirochaetae bacterium HGW-Spirochaetae-6]